MKILLLALIALASSCQTPLAPTTRPILDAPELVGEWTMTLENDGDEWPLRIEVVGAPEPSSLRTLIGIQHRPQTTRYHGEATFPTAAGTDPKVMAFDGQVVEANGHKYLTFQRALAENELAYIYLFEVPLQNTLRMELDGDELRLLIHEKRYVWVPMALSGKMEIGDGEESAGFFGALVPSLDAVLDAYEDTRDEDWQVLCRGRRT